jgi:AAA+ superfamily predicted ATPase
VTSLLLQADSLSSYTVLIAATNHQELLDRAVWRRFQVCLSLPLPRIHEIQEWIKRFEGRLGHSLKAQTSDLAAKLKGANFAELDDLGTAILRRKALADPSTDIQQHFAHAFRAWTLRRQASKLDKNRPR